MEDDGGGVSFRATVSGVIIHSVVILAVSAIALATTEADRSLAAAIGSSPETRS